MPKTASPERPQEVTEVLGMKAGTFQKLIPNMITTRIKMGRVKGNKTVDMQLSNKKLVNRGIKMIVEELNISKKEASLLLEKHRSVRKFLTIFGRLETETFPIYVHLGRTFFKLS